MAFSLACDDGASPTILRIEGADTNITFNDVWEFGAGSGNGAVTGDANGNAAVSDFITEYIASAIYVMLLNLQIGDGTNALTLEVLNTMLYFADDKFPVIKDESTFALGHSAGIWGQTGAAISWKLAANFDIIADGDTNAVFKTYNSMITARGADDFAPVFKSGTWYARSFVYAGDNARKGNLNLASGTIDWEDVTVSNINAFIVSVTPSNFSNIHSHRCEEGLRCKSASDITVPNLEVTDAVTDDIKVDEAIDLTLRNPSFHPAAADIQLVNASGAVIEQYTCNIHGTDKDGADLEGVTIDCEYAHLVEGTDSKTYKCIQDHTSVDATHEPPDGTDWASFWELYDSGGGLGGPWQTTFDYKAGEEEFATKTTNVYGELVGPELVSNGDFATGDFTSWDENTEPGTSIVGNACQFDHTGGLVYLSQDFGGIVGQTYKVSYEITANTGITGGKLRTPGSCIFGDLYDWPLTIGVHERTLEAINNSPTYDFRFLLTGTAPADTITVDNISIRELGTVIQYKKWAGTSELLEARIHKFTFGYTGYPDFVMTDVIVDDHLVWKKSMPVVYPKPTLGAGLNVSVPSLGE